MAKLTDVARRKVQHICIFGDSRSGKSELAASVASLPIFKRVIWISIDNGHEILFKLPQEAQEKIDLIVLPDTQGFPVAYATCQKLISGKLCRICDRHGQVDCSICKKEPTAMWSEVELGNLPVDTIVVFDHISELADSTMNYIMNKKKGEDAFPGWDEFRLQGMLMDRFLLAIQQAPYNVICIAQIIKSKLEDDTVHIVPLTGTGPFSGNAAKYFDHTIYCRVVNHKHTFVSRSTASSIAVAGSRADVAIEDQKEGRPSLLPFFQGKWDHLSNPRSKEADAGDVIQQLKNSLGETVEETTGQKNAEIIGVKDLPDLPEAALASEEEEKAEPIVIYDTTLNEQYKDGKVPWTAPVQENGELNHIVEAASTVVPAEVKVEAQMTQAEKAKERLRRLRAGEKV